MNDIEIIYQSGWHDGFNCEARQHLGRDKGNLYYIALEVSPDHDPRQFKWDGPYREQETAHLALDNKLDRWNTQMDWKRQVWEERQKGTLQERIEAARGHHEPTRRGAELNRPRGLER